ncbi:hypothetical protein [Actinopolyspora halophila]|uniref:hypothetical protein n=1 Tax=Actinopolyspora halophila TaxID=1850 RepID=UPI0003A18137|nr:hypothetical protein [Actinopolyspora halophila]
MNRGELAVWAAHEQWRMEQLAYDLAGGHATGRQCREAAAVFDHLAAQLRGHADGLDGTVALDEPDHD